MIPFDITKLKVDSLNWAPNVKTRNGERVKILSTTVEGVLPIIFEYEGTSFRLGGVAMRGRDGKHFTNDSEYDLIMIPEKQKVWINLYPSKQHGIQWGSRKEADDHVFTPRIACIPIEFFEGEGLEGETK